MDSADADTQREVRSPVEASGAGSVPVQFIYTAPWWVLVLILLGVYVVFLIVTDTDYGGAFQFLQLGIPMTLYVSFSAYGLALIIGLLVGLARVNPPRPALHRDAGGLLALLKVVVYNVATLYVEVLRGLPILIIILIVAFVAVPRVSDVLGVDINGSSPPSAIAALALFYGAFLSETFRAGIQSISKGQIEAARSLGMTYVQTMQFVVLPQAVRVILPPLGNDLISMIKDSSLVAFLGIRDVTQRAKLWSGQNFLYVQTYVVAAVIYLSITIVGTRFVRLLERKMRMGV